MNNANCYKMPLIWSLTLLVVIGPITVHAYGCEPFNSTGKPRFTKRLGQQDYVRIFNSKELDCCAGGVDSILWYRKENGIWNSYPSSRSDPHAFLVYSNQTLEIKSAGLSDNTSFKCALMKDGVSVMENVVALHVLNCDQLAKGPILTAPFPVNQTIEKFGVNITFPCTGYFGCDDNDRFEHFIMWRVKGRWLENISSIDSRYSTKTFHSLGYVTLQSNLNIQSVSEVDLNRTFVCQLVSPQIIHGQTDREVRIFKRDPPNYMKYIIIAVCCGGGIILLIILAVVLRRFYGPQFRVYMGTRIKMFPPWPISAEDLEHNAFIYHADDDTGTARDIQQKLSEYDLKIRISDDLQRGQLEISTIETEIKNCAKVLFIYSKNLVVDSCANFVIEGLIQESQGSIVFIQIETDIEAGDFNPEFWKNIQKLKYPSENASGRKKKHFFCTLVRQIPKFKKQEVKQKNLKHDIKRTDRQMSSSSARPLIDTPLPSPSPVIVEVQGNIDVRPVPEDPTLFQYEGLKNTDHSNGHVEGQYWDDFEATRNADGLVNVHVHRSGDTEVLNPGQLNQEGLDFPGTTVIEQGGPVRGTLSTQSSESDTGSSGVFWMSQEGGYQSMQSGTGADVHTLEDEANLHHNVTGRKDSSNTEGYGQDQTSMHHGNQNPNLHVEIKGNRLHNSCSSPETGYTSMSPERQRDLVSFERSNSNVPVQVNN